MAAARETARGDVVSRVRERGGGYVVVGVAGDVAFVVVVFDGGGDARGEIAGGRREGVDATPVVVALAGVQILAHRGERLFDVRAEATERARGRRQVRLRALGRIVRVVVVVTLVATRRPIALPLRRLHQALHLHDETRLGLLEFILAEEREDVLQLGQMLRRHRAPRCARRGDRQLRRHSWMRVSKQ